MTIVVMVQVVLAPVTTEDQIGHALFMRSLMHMSQFLGNPGLGLSYDSCNAAVAVNLGGPYEALNVGAQNFAVVHGSSRLYQGLDPSLNAIHMHVSPTRPFSSSALQEHAEQTAIRVAISEGQVFFDYQGRNHIYIDLSPCPSCYAWLDARPEDWYVHYYTLINHQAPIAIVKKKMRSKLFGRQMEKRAGPKGIVKPRRLRRR